MKKFGYKLYVVCQVMHTWYEACNTTTSVIVSIPDTAACISFPIIWALTPLRSCPIVPHPPVFARNVSRLFPTAEEDLTASKVSSLVMRRHGRKDGRKDGASVDITRRR